MRPGRVVGPSGLSGGRGLGATQEGGGQCAE